MADPRLIAVALDDRTIVRRNADIDQERRVAIFDLIEGNSFAPQRGYPDGYTGPYRLMLRAADGRLAFEIAREDGRPLETIIFGMLGFRRSIRDYFAICDSYFQALRRSTPQQIETVDMARRAIHNEAAERLMERMKSKIEIDFDTARRLFTLICALHIRE